MFRSRYWIRSNFRYAEIPTPWTTAPRSITPFEIHPRSKQPGLFAPRKLLLNNSPWTTTPQTIVPMKFLPGQLPPELLPPEQLLLKSFPPHNYPQKLHPLNSSQDIVSPRQLPPDNCPSPLRFFHGNLPLDFWPTDIFPWIIPPEQLTIDDFSKWNFTKSTVYIKFRNFE